MTDPVAPKPARAAPEHLAPPDWKAIEPHYKAGLRSKNSISREFGVSRAGIEKHAAKFGWVYGSLAPSIHSQADRIVAERAIAAQSEKGRAETKVDRENAAKPLFTDAEVVEAGAQQLALVKLEHRRDIADLRAVVRVLMGELSEVTRRPDVLRVVRAALSRPGLPTEEALKAVAAMVEDLPRRTKVAKDLADAMHKCIGMEREAFGLDTKGGADGVPVAIIRDYTGKGDADAPARKANQYADE